MVTENKKLQQWVDDKIKLCQPDDVVWCDGSEEEWSRMWDILVKGGTAKNSTKINVPIVITFALFQLTWHELKIALSSALRRKKMQDLQIIGAHQLKCEEH